MPKHLLIVSLLAALVGFIFVDTAGAVSRRAPDPNDMDPSTNTYFIETSKRGYSNGLHAPDSTIILYFRNPSGTLNIVSGDSNCSAPGGGSWRPDGTVAASTRFYLYRGTAPLSTNIYSGGGWGSDGKHENEMSCGTTSFNLSGLPEITIGSDTFYAATLVARNSADNSINGWRAVISSGIVSYYSSSGDKFALQERRGDRATNPFGDADNGDKSDFILKFGTDCRLTSSQRARLSWFDDDYFGRNATWIDFDGDGTKDSNEEYNIQSRALRFRLVEERPDGSERVVFTTSDSQSEFTGNNRPGSVTFTARPQHKYRWEWLNVNRENGIQFQLPYNSVFYNADCDRGEWDYRPIIRNNPGNSHSSLDNRPIPTGGFAGDPYRERYVGDPDADWSTPPVIRVRARVFNDGNYQPTSATHDVIVRLISTENTTPSPNSEPSGDPVNTRQNDVDVRERTSTDGIDGGGGHYARYNSVPGIAPGNRNNYLVDFVLQEDRISVQNDRVCFEVGVRRHEGEEPNNVTSGNSWTWSGRRCWRFLQTYNITDVSVGGPDFAKPGENVTFNLTAYNNGDGRSVKATSVGYNQPAAQRRWLFFEQGSPGTINSDDQALAIDGNAGYSDGVNVTVPDGAGVGDLYCLRLVFRDYRGLFNGYVTSPSTGSRSDQKCIRVTTGPYFGVGEGSVFAGMELGNRTTDWADPLIASSESTATGDWVGGVAEFAALALGEISGFSSKVTLEQAVNTSDNVPQRGGTPQELIGLTFANVDDNGNRETGYLGSAPYRSADLYRLYDDNFDPDGVEEHRAQTDGAIPNETDLINPSPSGAANYRIIKHSGDVRLAHSGGIDLKGSNIDIVLIVSGSVQIDGNIELFRDSYNSIDEIPSFTLIAEGNITIGGNDNTTQGVTRLDGTYIAAGDFDTCSGETELATNVCSNQLTVNGIALADRFLLKRTHGGTTGANGSTEPAEQFIHAPEVYLSPPPLPFSDLPSVSSLIDLPPLF